MQTRKPETTMIVAAATQANFEEREASYRRVRTEILVIAGVCLLAASPASAAGGIGLGTGRVVPAVAAVVGLIGVVLGGLAVTAPPGVSAAMGDAELSQRPSRG